MPVIATHPGTSPHVRRPSMLAVMCVGMFLVQLDVTIVNVALPHIDAALQAGLSGIQWIVDTYTVALAAGLMAGGWLTDRAGARVAVLSSLVAFLSASLACGLAPSADFLIGFRAVAGTAAAVLLPSTLAIVNSTYTDKQSKARAIGIWAGISALALPAGPLVGGALVQLLGWRSIFLINVPIIGCAFVAAWRLLPRGGGRSGAARLDVVGLSAAAVTLSGVVIAAIEFGAGHQQLATGAAATAVAGLLVTCWWERRSASPFIPPALRVPRFVAPNVVAGMMNFVGIGIVFVATLYLQVVTRATPLETGLRLLPLFLPLAIGAPLTGRLAARAGPRLPMLLGLLLGILGCCVLATTHPHTSLLVFSTGLFCVGAGMGLLTPAVVTACLSAAPVSLSGVASGVNNAARQASSALGVAVFGAIAGEPGHPIAFAAGVRHLSVMSVGLWVAAIALTYWFVSPARQSVPD